MGSSAEHGETLISKGPLDRRAFGLGLAQALGLTLGFMGPIRALAQTASQTAPLPPPLASPYADPNSPAALSANMLTRMGARTTLNGRSFVFVLDTGAARTALSQEVATALALPAGPDVLVHGVTSAQVTPSVHLERLIFCGRRFNDLNTPVFPRAQLAADGLLGLDVLTKFSLQLDLTRREATITPTASEGVSIEQGYTPTRIRQAVRSRARQGRFGQLFLINTTVGGIEVDAFVDSGAQYSIGNLALYRALNRSLVSGSLVQNTGQFGLSPGEPLPHKIQVYGVTGQVLEAQPGVVRTVEINRQQLGPTPLLFADLYAFGVLNLAQRPALLIGADILYRFSNITLDFGRSRMRFSGLRAQTSQSRTV